MNMNAIFCTILFLFISFFPLSTILVGASPTLPAHVPHFKDVSLHSVSSSTSSYKRAHTHVRSITEPYPSIGKQRLLVVTVQYPDEVIFLIFFFSRY